MEMKVGMKYETEIVVNEGMLANHNDPQLPAIELPAVFSTPSMINLMELTCAKLMDNCLEEGKGSVGMSVEVKHLASTPCGKKVRCEVEITEVVNGKKVTFEDSCIFVRRLLTSVFLSIPIFVAADNISNSLAIFSTE